MSKVYKNETVLEAARKRIRWIFSEFENVVVSFSGGKDSTVVLNLTLEVARELGRLPQKVLWLDQEAEWQATVDMVTEVMESPEVEPYWLQVPFRLFNATSTEEHWLKCWDKDKEKFWVHPQVPYSIKVNNFGTDRFMELCDAIPKTLWPDKKTAMIGGVRCDESPTRSMGLVSYSCYKWVTWGKRMEKDKTKNGNTMFYPIYDWCTSDVWRAIHEHGWSYCKLYDNLYRHGVPVANMRLSNVHHETAVWSLFVLQEIEPKTYERIVARIQGIDMAGKLGLADYFPKELPSMFGSWVEYRDYLLEKLISDESWKAGFRKQFAKMEELLGGKGDDTKMHKVQVTSILCNDWEGIKLENFMTNIGNYKILKKGRDDRRKEKLKQKLKA
jgi:predicted phosphoadenosine phosphosulfate sulfurtransferase